ncbi:zinc finger protein RFP-like, partial [Mauremys mutica]|uniref:zinc finger protein RFP-like n=1 Tax=Mauremys mutica TaxID=74926 RepID=UPI001D16A4DB
IPEFETKPVTNCPEGAMAAENPMERLQEEATCPICLEYFTEPVTLECGHNFCRACISQCWEGSDTAASCPQCREIVQQGNLRPNRQLANILELFNLQAAKGAGGDGVCERHQEALKLFCEADQTPICVVCDRSRAHRTHTVVPIEEAAQEYKERVQSHLKTLREEREKVLGLKATGERNCREYLKQTQTERQKIVSEFQQLQEFLEEEERLLLAQLEKLDKKIVRIQNENVSKLSEQISHLSELISEMEGKCQKPVSKFLQDVRTTLSRYVAPSHSTMLGKSLMMRVAPHLPGALQQNVWGDPMLDTNLSDQLHPGLLTLKLALKGRYCACAIFRFAFGIFRCCWPRSSLLLRRHVAAAGAWLGCGGLGLLVWGLPTAPPSHPALTTSPCLPLAPCRSRENRSPEITAAMASGTPVREIQEETSCPICLEYLTDPVTIQCGHNFCRGCISQYCETWEEQDSDPLCCPSCRARIRKGAFQSNYQLANIEEKNKQMDFKQGKENLCERHGKALDLFCEEDGEAVCVVCERSLEHRSHTVLLMDDAAQKYKERIQAHLKTLREEREKLLGLKATGEGNSREYLKQTQTERQKIVSEFQQVQQFLEEQERLLLAQLEKLDKEIVRIQNENVSKRSEQISCLSELISEVEGKCQKPASEFLQDVRTTMSRCEMGKFQQPEEISPELEERVSGFSQKTIVLLEILGKFKDTLPSELERKRGESFGAHRQANVTLDLDTAHPNLVLSEDRKSVRWGDTRQQLPNNPERFDYWSCVLGCEGFTSGRHCWEVEVGGGRYWAVGVARESVGRKGLINLGPEGGIWAVEWGGQFQALTSPETPLPLSRFPSRIRVCLDCDRGQVTFIDAGDEAPIFTFPPGSIPGERIRPWLWVWPGSQFRLCP